MLSEGISAVRVPLTHHATQCWTVELGDLSTVNIVVPSVDIRQCSAENRARKKSIFKFSVQRQSFKACQRL